MVWLQLFPIEQTIKLSLILDTMALTWRHCIGKAWGQIQMFFVVYVAIDLLNNVYSDSTV